MKKYPWFYKFEDIFHKHPGIKPPLIIESCQWAKHDEAAVDEDNLRNYDFDLDLYLKEDLQLAKYETEREDNTGINLFDLGSNSNSSIHSALSLIAKDARRETCKKANENISREVEGENNNFTIVSDDEEENEGNFPIQVYTSNSARPSYLWAKSQQASTNTSSERPLTLSLSTSSKLEVQNRNWSSSFKNRISKRKHHSDFDQLLHYVEDIQGL